MVDSTLYAQSQGKEGRPETALDWQPIFERALQEYVQEQRGGVTTINTRNLLKYLRRTEGYPAIETEAEATHVTKLLNGFFSRFFGPLWDGAKYLDNRSVGRSVLLGTDNILDLIRYKKEVKLP